MILSIFRFFLHPQDSRFSNSCISAKYYHKKPYINVKIIYYYYYYYLIKDNIHTQDVYICIILIFLTFHIRLHYSHSKICPLSISDLWPERLVVKLQYAALIVILIACDTQALTSMCNTPCWGWPALHSAVICYDLMPVTGNLIYPR